MKWKLYIIIVNTCVLLRSFCLCPFTITTTLSLLGFAIIKSKLIIDFTSLINEIPVNNF
jgi:hypothetical protein